MLRSMLRAWVGCFALLLLGCTSPQVVSPKPGTTLTTDVITTRDLVDVLQVLSEPYEGRTLLALDIDDTLLTSPRFFGSDAWYEWQKTLSPQAPGYVPCKFDVIAMSYEVGTQVPTQADAVAAINAITLDKIMITSRSPMYRNGTIRELEQAGYQLPPSLQPGLAGAIYDYQPEANHPGVTLSYHQGVLMAAGQNKGRTLIDLMRHLQIEYDRVVLVDDGEKNINEMREATTSAGIDYRGVHYTRIDKKVTAARERQGIEAWQAWQELLATVYPDRLERIKANQCGL